MYHILKERSFRQYLQTNDQRPYGCCECNKMTVSALQSRWNSVCFVLLANTCLVIAAVHQNWASDERLVALFSQSLEISVKSAPLLLLPFCQPVIKPETVLTHLSRQLEKFVLVLYWGKRNQHRPWLPVVWWELSTTDYLHVTRNWRFERRTRQFRVQSNRILTRPKRYVACAWAVHLVVYKSDRSKWPSLTQLPQCLQSKLWS